VLKSLLYEPALRRIETRPRQRQAALTRMLMPYARKSWVAR
jgi:hypothetical protein